MERKIKLKEGDIVVTKKIVGKHVIVDRYKALNPNTKQYRTFYLGSIMADFVEFLGTNSTNKERQEYLKTIPSNQKGSLRHLHVVRIERKPKWYISILNKLAFWKKRK